MSGRSTNSKTLWQQLRDVPVVYDYATNKENELEISAEIASRIRLSNKHYQHLIVHGSFIAAPHGTLEYLLLADF